MIEYKTINGEKYFKDFEDAAEFLGCSVQTIRRYTDHRQQEDRRMHMKKFRDSWGMVIGPYLPLSEAERFRDEIRPKFRFGGRDGRKKGSKDKKPRKKPEQRQFSNYTNLT
jgi:hypothetical protein